MRGARGQVSSTEVCDEENSKPAHAKPAYATPSNDCARGIGFFYQIIAVIGEHGRAAGRSFVNPPPERVVLEGLCIVHLTTTYRVGASLFGRDNPVLPFEN